MHELASGLEVPTSLSRASVAAVSLDPGGRVDAADVDGGIHTVGEFAAG